MAVQFGGFKSDTERIEMFAGDGCIFDAAGLRGGESGEEALRLSIAWLHNHHGGRTNPQ